MTLKDPALDGGGAIAADCHWWSCLLQKRQLHVNVQNTCSKSTDGACAVQRKCLTRLLTA